MLCFPTSPILVLQHYLANEETQKTAHWCFVRATHVQLLQRSQLPFSWTMPLPPPTAHSWTHWLLDLGSQTVAWLWVVSQKDWRNQDWRNQAATGWILAKHLIQRVKNAIFVFPVLPGSAEAQVIWRSIVTFFWLLTLSVALLPQISKSIHVYQSYSKPKVGHFLRHGV